MAARDTDHAILPWADYGRKPQWHRSTVMLLLSAILHMWLPREVLPNDLLAESRQRLGTLGLTIIALVFVLVTFWQR